MRAAEIHIVIHRPKTKQTQQELAARIAVIHAQAVAGYIRKLNCSAEQKTALADSAIGKNSTQG